ncbi:unnamed protein product, partial [Fusarium graminearum]
YGRQLRWMVGVASKGLMKDTAYVSCPTTTPTYPSKKRHNLVVVEYEPSLKFQASAGASSSTSSCSSRSPLSITASPPTQLTDPIFQDMGYNTRYLLDYFDRKVCSVLTFTEEAWTPYRELMALVGSSKGVAHAMTAVAALHAIHGSTGSPIMLAHALQENHIQINDIRLNPFQSQLLHHCIHHKQKALEFLSTALQDPDQKNKLQTFGIAIVLALLECFETGAGSWAIHLEGAKKLLEAGIQNSPALEGLVDELMLFEIFGSTFVPPGVVSTSVTTRTLSTTASDTRLVFGNSFVCPVAILQSITLATAMSRTARQAMSDLSATFEGILAIGELKSVLVKIQQFSCLEWVEEVKPTAKYLETVSNHLVVQMCLIWKLSAEIYISRLLYSLTRDTQYLSPITDDLITAFVPIKSTVYLKFLTWPVVVAGLSSTTHSHRAWTLSTLDEIWRLTLVASAKGAREVLLTLWAMRDSRINNEGDGYREDWDWLCDIAALKNHWLLF